MSVVTVESFARIKRMILEGGDRRTYCNRYNHNPHVEVDGFHAYLDPETGNIDCDPARSDFDELVIQDWNADPIYYRARVTGDALTFDPTQLAPLERYFAALLALAR